MPLTTTTSALAGRAPALLRFGRRCPRALPARSFSVAAFNGQARVPIKQSQPLQKRLGTITVARHYSAIASQEAPNPKAYINSGVIKPQQAVNVKKVLVIGSGGLAIGQAGEFDYSGTFSTTHPTGNTDTYASVLALSWTASKVTWTDFVFPPIRIPSSQGSQGGWSCFSTDQSQHRDHSNQPFSCRRSILPTRHCRVCHLCH